MEKRPPASVVERCVRNLSVNRMNAPNIYRLMPKSAVARVKLHHVALIQRFVAALGNSGIMHEKILRVLAEDKTVALTVVKPSYYAIQKHHLNILIPILQYLISVFYHKLNRDAILRYDYFLLLLYFFVTAINNNKPCSTAFG